MNEGMKTRKGRSKFVRLNYKEIVAIRKEQERLFLEKHGYEWPNCSIVECDYKVWVTGSSAFCYAHAHGLPIVPIEDYFNGNN
jgi:hypothetical protein